MSDQTIVARWNEIALQAVRYGEAKPTEITRALHIAHSAMYDAWAAYDEDATGAYSDLTADGIRDHLSQATAISAAAHKALIEVFPDYRFLFDTLLATLRAEADAAGEIPPEAAIQIGLAAAQGVIDTRADDGSNADNDFADTSGYVPVNPDSGEDIVDPNHWTPLRVPNGTVRDENGIPVATDNPATYDLQKPLSPHWGDVDPFAIESGDAYRPVAPPQLGDFSEYVDQTGKVTTGDAAYREQFGQVLEISANLTAEQKATAEYWADGPRSSTPPGHWNEIAQDVALREGHSLGQDAKFFFALNNAMFDAGIAIWDAKFAYDYVRPQTAIRHLFEGQEVEAWIGPDQGIGTIDGGDWVPYQNVTFVTPPFPEYGSGHSSFSYAAATIIAEFTGSDVLFDGVSRGVQDLDGDGLGDLIGQHITTELDFESYDGPPIELSWDTVWDAAADAGLSRLYGGIHIQDGDLSARTVGAEVAADVWAATSELFGDATPDMLELGSEAAVVAGALDNLDGLRVAGFDHDDAIAIDGLSLADGGLSVKRGSAILEVDSDGDGTPDGTITLEGDYDGMGFRAMSEGGRTVLALAAGGDIALTDASEALDTEDGTDNAIAAGAGDDTVRAGGGADVIDGDGGDDLLEGEGGNDTLIGGSGDDTLTGGAGRDVFAIDISDGAGTDRITDYQRGIDRIELSGFGQLGPRDVQLSLVDGDLKVTLENGQSVILEGIGSLRQVSLGDVDLPSDGRNVSFAELDAQTLTDADDGFLSQGDFDDEVKGGDGDDLIFTGAGDDTITGGAGADTMDGGAGADLFRITADDIAGPGQVDVIRNFQSRSDQVQFIGLPGIAGLDDLRLTRVDGDLAIDFGGGHLLAFEGITRLTQLNPRDAIFGGDDPEITVGLIRDTGQDDGDGVTSDASISGTLSDDVGVAKLEVRIGNGNWLDITEIVRPDGGFAIPGSVVEERLGEGARSTEFRVTDVEGKTAIADLDFTLDTTGPQQVGAASLNADLDALTLTLSEALADATPGAGSFTLRDNSGATVQIASVDRDGPDTITLNLSAPLAGGAFTLTGSVADAAGNVGTLDTSVSVSSGTRVVAILPTDGAERANLDRKITVEFNRPVDGDTIDAASIKITALGESLEGRYSLSSDGKLVTFFPDELLPAATSIRVTVDGERVRAADGGTVDTADTGSVTFATSSLTRVAGTDVEGFIFDANYRDEDGLDIPLEGVVVSVIGLPGVSAVTDENGRFLLEDLPIPQVYLDFDASDVTNRPNFDYGTITKPVDTIAGQTVGLSSGDKAFNIYFAALAEADTTDLVAGEATEAGIGENGLANLTEIFPGIDPTLWSQLKVIIPADSLTRDDGTAVEEVQVMAFEPDRIPAPLPQGFDPTVVFTVKAGDATNVDGNAQIEFPNIDQLDLGERRPILSFDHDGGVWVQTGTAVVVDDGNGGTILRSEGDSGVNTLGWKAVGDEAASPFGPDPENSPNENEPDCDWISIGANSVGTIAGLVGLGVAIGFGAPVVGVAAAVIGLGAAVVGAVNQSYNDGGPNGSSVGGVVAGGVDAGVALGEDGLTAAATRVTGSAGSAGVLVKGAGILGGVAGTALSAKGLYDDLSPKFGSGGGAAFGDEALFAATDFGGNSNLLGTFATDTTAAAEALAASYDALFGEIFISLLPDDRPTNAFLSREGDTIILIGDDGQELKDANGDVYSVEIADIVAAFDATTAEAQAGFAALETAYTEVERVLADTDDEAVDAAIYNAVTVAEEAFAGENPLAPPSEDGKGPGPETGELFFLVTTFPDGTEVARGSGSASEIQFLLQSESTFSVKIYDATNAYYGDFIVQTQAFGEPAIVNGVENGRYTLQPLEGSNFLADADGDALLDIAEAVIGTRPDVADTDGDGVSDSAELEQGLDPLDGIAFPTGIIGSTALRGEALDVTLTGAIDGSGGQTAYVATGSHGLAIVDASRFQNPILQAELDLAGTAKQVAVDAGRNLAFVAADAGGLHVVDVSDPLAPVLVASTAISGGAQSVVDLGGTLLVGGGSGLALLNAATGARIATFDAGGRVNDIAVDGDTAYAIVGNRELVSYRIAGSGIVELARETFPQSTIRTIPDDKTVFVNEGVAYVANALEVVNVPLFRLEERGGYLTYDVSDPADISLISNIDTPRVQSGNLETIVNGSGLALVAGGFRGLQVHDASDPDVTYDLLAEFATPGTATGVALASGIVYVADGTGGLQVVNVLPFDANGVAPQVSLDAAAVDADPDTAGIQIEEGQRIELSLDLSDDVQVRNVELLLNGVVVLNDVSAPFGLSFDVPPLAGLDDTELSIQVRATDTGGNSTITDAVTVNVIPDITPPELLSATPQDGRLVLRGNEVFTLGFSERIDQTTLTADDITLIRLSDGATIAPSGVVFLTGGQTAQVSFAPLDLGAYSISVNLSGVTDLAGNAIDMAAPSQGFEIVDATAIWAVPAGGSWEVATNWRDDRLPDASDGVAVVLNDGAVVTIRSDVEVDQLRLGGTLRLEFGSLTAQVLEGTVGTFQQQGGTVEDSTLRSGDTFDILVGGTTSFTSTAWDGVRLEGDARVQYSRLDIEGGLTLNGTLLLDDDPFGTVTTGFARVRLQEGQTVSGEGTIRLDGVNATLRSTNFLGSSGNAEGIAVIDTGIDISGQGTLGGYSQTSLQILGQVTADGGALAIGNVDQGGAALQLDSTSTGWVELNTDINDARLTIAQDADIRLTAGTHSDLNVAGPGTLILDAGTIDGLTIAAGGTARVDDVANFSNQVNVEGDLRIDGQLDIAGEVSRTATLRVSTASEIGGDGTLFLSQSNVEAGETARSTLTLAGSNTSPTAEILTLGEDLTLAGAGTVNRADTTDRLRILGQVRGDDQGRDARLDISGIDQGGGTLDVDTTDGDVRLTGTLENAILTGVGEVDLDGAQMRGVTVDGAARVVSTTTGTVSSQTFDGLTVDGTFTVDSGDTGAAQLIVDGVQDVDGDGRIVLTGASGQARLQMDGDSVTGESATFGADLTIAGNGLVRAVDTGDSVRILGTLEGVAGGILSVEDLDNGGAAVSVDAGDGAVQMDGIARDTVFRAAGSDAGTLSLGSGATLDGVKLDIDAQIAATSNTTFVNVVNGLAVGEDLTIEAGVSQTVQLRFFGEQSIEGTGDIRLTNGDAPNGAFQLSRLFIDGVLNASETLTIDSDITVTGVGQVYAQDTGDLVAVDGTLLADDGTLDLTDLTALEGTIGATATGLLDLDGTLTMTERGTLSFGITADGTGSMAVDGDAILAGTLALDVASGFSAALGATFDLIDVDDAIFGEFDDFTGFDLAGDRAFELVQTATGDLQLRVTTDASARAGGFIDRAPFTPGPRDPDAGLTAVALDQITGTLTDARLTGPATPGTTTRLDTSITLINVTLQSDVTGAGEGFDQRIAVERGLTLDGADLIFDAPSDGGGRLTFNGDQTLDGAGTLDFGRAASSTDQNVLTLASRLTGAERLVIGDDINIVGSVDIGASSPTLDRVQITGTLIGRDGETLTVGDIDNDGETLTVDARAGVVEIADIIEDTRLDGQGTVMLRNGLDISNTTLSMDAEIVAGFTANTVTVIDGLTLDGANLALEGRVRTATLTFDGEQIVGGDGQIELMGGGLTDTLNQLRFIGRSNLAETLTFGDGIDIVGTGVVGPSSADDVLRILGGVAAQGGDLVLNDIDNDGADLTLLASDGRLIFEDTLQDVRLVSGADATAYLGNGLSLRDVTLATDTRLEGDSSSFASVGVDGGLVLDDADLTLSTLGDRTSQLIFRGGQEVTGTGDLRLVSATNLLGQSTAATLSFTGLRTTEETFVLGEDIDLRGAGNVTVSTGDLLEVRGDIIAENGTLALNNLGALTGDVTVAETGRLTLNLAAGMDVDTTLTMALDGSGDGARSGLIQSQAALGLAGTFAFDLADGFDAEIGDEFTLIQTRAPLTGRFGTVSGFEIDADKALALVVDGSTLRAVVVDAAQGGRQFTPTTLPGGQPPVLATSITDTTIDADFAGADLAFAAGNGNVWTDVTLDSDVMLTIRNQTSSSFSQLTVNDGLTLDGTLILDGETAFGTSLYGYSRMLVSGAQTIDGTGEIELRGGTGAFAPTNGRAVLRLQGQTGDRETVTLGEDVSLTGAGQLQTFNDDRWQILGDVIARDGFLTLRGIDQDGETLSLDSEAGGTVLLTGIIEDAVVSLAGGASGQISSAQLDDVTLTGAGTHLIGGSSATDLSVDGRAEIRDNSTLTIISGLEVDGTLELVDEQSQRANLSFSGTQTVGGMGQIRLSHLDTEDGIVADGTVSLVNTTSVGTETLTFGADLDLIGVGQIEATGTGDVIRILGNVIGDDGGTDRFLRLSRVDQDDGALSVDARNGDVVFATALSNTRLTGQGEAKFASGLQLDGVTLDMAAEVLAGTTSVLADGGLTVNGTLSLQSAGNTTSNLSLSGTQTLGGTGTIDLSDGSTAQAIVANTNLDAPITETAPVNTLVGRSLISGEEVFVLGEDLTITGAGRVHANSAADSIRILGDVVGSADGVLLLEDIDNAGATLTVDASVGEVQFADTVTDATLTAASGQTGRIGFASGTILTDVNLDIDAVVGSAAATRSLIARDGLTLGEELTIAAGDGLSATLTLQGAQAIGGTGRITLSPENAPAEDFVRNQLFLDGLSTDVETFVIGSGIEVIGTGTVRVVDTGDLLDIRGQLIADDGLLDVDGLATVTGTVGTRADGLLDIDEGLTLTSSATLRIGLDADGAGSVLVDDGTALGGTLRLDVGSDFIAQAGDTFDFLQSADGLTGSFDAYAGFDLAGDLAFELITDTDTLMLRVTTDDEAAAFL